MKGGEYALVRPVRPHKKHPTFFKDHNLTLKEDR